MPPTLVLLPGMDGTGELFSPFLASLGSDFETLIVRYPTNEVLSLAELTALAQSKLPADKRFVLLAGQAVPREVAKVARNFIENLA
jgi:hypothetical protein